MQWLQHNVVWIGLVLAIIAIFFIIAHLTKGATIHDGSDQTPDPALEDEHPLITPADKVVPGDEVTLKDK